jgi:hypothetical protein
MSAMALYVGFVDGEAREDYSGNKTATSRVRTLCRNAHRHREFRHASHYSHS